LGGLKYSIQPGALYLVLHALIVIITCNLPVILMIAFGHGGTRSRGS
jgi:hypothetical protein